KQSRRGRVGADLIDARQTGKNRRDEIVAPILRRQIHRRERLREQRLEQSCELRVADARHEHLHVELLAGLGAIVLILQIWNGIEQLVGERKAQARDLDGPTAWGRAVFVPYTPR